MLGAAIGVVFGSLIGLSVIYRGYRRWRRAQAVLPEPQETVLRRVSGVSARVSTDEGRPGLAPQASGTRTHADAVLTASRLMVGTHEGRLIDSNPRQTLSVRCTGPRRLVIEAERPTERGTRRVRVELLVNDAEQWAADAQKTLKLPVVGAPTPALPQSPGRALS